MLGFINTCLTVVTGIVLAVILAVIGLMIALAEPESADTAGSQAVTKTLWRDPPVRQMPVVGGHA